MLWMERQGFIIRTRHNTVLVDTCGGENKQRTNPGFHKLALPWLGNLCAPVSSDNPMLNAFWRVAPSVRLSVLAIFEAGTFFRASDLRSRTCTAVQARFLFDPFFITNLFSGYKGRVLVALSWSKEKI